MTRLSKKASDLTWEELENAGREAATAAIEARNASIANLLWTRTARLREMRHAVVRLRAGLALPKRKRRLKPELAAILHRAFPGLPFGPGLSERLASRRKDEQRLRLLNRINDAARRANIR